MGPLSQQNIVFCVCLVVPVILVDIVNSSGVTPPFNWACRAAPFGAKGKCTLIQPLPPSTPPPPSKFSVTPPSPRWPTPIQRPVVLNATGLQMTIALFPTDWSLSTTFDNCSVYQSRWKNVAISNFKLIWIGWRGNKQEHPKMASPHKLPLGRLKLTAGSWLSVSNPTLGMCLGLLDGVGLRQGFES